MRKTYQQPQIKQVLLQGRVRLMSGSGQNEVNNYQKGSDFNVGDEDE